MINTHPTVREMALLHSICRKFVKDNDIESKIDISKIDPSDIYSFIEDICKIVGYEEYK